MIGPDAAVPVPAAVNPIKSSKGRNPGAVHGARPDVTNPTKPIQAITSAKNVGSWKVCLILTNYFS